MSLLKFFRTFVPASVHPGIPFTPRAQRVLELAHENARREGREIANSSDVVIGLDKLGQGVAWNVLKRFDIAGGTSKESPPNKASAVPYTELLPVAETEMRHLHHTYLGTEHLLLAVLSDKTNCLSILLSELGLTADTLREEIMRELDPNYIPPA
jgi:ATP-dependent Clp protease ATP-binding subunit ClpC